MGFDRIRCLVVCLLGLLLWAEVGIAGMQVASIRMGEDETRTRVVFDLSGPVSHAVFELQNPDRLVLDLEDATLGDVELPPATDLLLGIRSAVRASGDLRVVLDLAEPVHVQSFLVRPHGDYGYRLVVDMRPRIPRIPVPVQRRAGDLIVAIDAGHGGRDPGAIGPGGTYEKDVVLPVALKLAALIDAEPGMRAILTRDTDVFVALSARRERARAAGADLFVSVHADAVPHGGPRGSSVYTLSRQRALQEQNRLLGNAGVDDLRGLSGDGRDRDLTNVLLDLSRGATLEFSNDLAGELLQALSSVGPVHKSYVERAGFAVLRSLDMPSVLVELAFISNPQEERRLRQDSHQQRLAETLRNGIVRYASRMYPGVVQQAALGMEHRVRSGETLTSIARRYSISVTELRGANRLAGDRIDVGSLLRIP